MSAGLRPHRSQYPPGCPRGCSGTSLTLGKLLKAPGNPASLCEVRAPGARDCLWPTQLLGQWPATLAYPEALMPPGAGEGTRRLCRPRTLSPPAPCFGTMPTVSSSPVPWPAGGGDLTQAPAWLAWLASLPPVSSVPGVLACTAGRAGSLNDRTLTLELGPH